MATPPNPSRPAFNEYRKDYGDFSWRLLLPYALYVGGLGLFTSAVVYLDPDRDWAIASLFVAVAYLFFIPYFWLRKIHTHFAYFIRCPHCGNWFAGDSKSEGVYQEPDLKYNVVIETGKCQKCGTQILAETISSDVSNPPIDSPPIRGKEN